MTKAPGKMRLIERLVGVDRNDLMTEPAERADALYRRSTLGPIYNIFIQSPLKLNTVQSQMARDFITRLQKVAADRDMLFSGPVCVDMSMSRRHQKCRPPRRRRRARCRTICRRSRRSATDRDQDRAPPHESCRAQVCGRRKPFRAHAGIDTNLRSRRLRRTEGQSRARSTAAGCSIEKYPRPMPDWLETTTRGKPCFAIARSPAAAPSQSST